jgi:protein-disulfide isomerase
MSTPDRRPGPGGRARPLQPLRWLLASTLLATTQWGCAGERSAATRTANGAAAETRDPLPEVLATVDDEAVTMGDVRAMVGETLDRLQAAYERERHEAVKAALDEIVRERILGAEAERLSTTVDELVLLAAGGGLEPTGQEITTWYRQNAPRLGGRTLEQLRPQIVDLLRRRRIAEVTADLERRLDRASRVSDHLGPYRADLDNVGSPSMGPDDAPVTVVEFSDFACPYCRRFSPTLGLLRDAYGDRLRIVYRQFPIAALHPDAPKAAEASLCAAEQRRFWDMHDLLFQEQGGMTGADLKDKAGRLGMDRASFDSCLDSGRHAERVQADIREGTRVGVTGTPALFVNGIAIEGGAVDYAVVAEAIDRELERAAR